MNIRDFVLPAIFTFATLYIINTFIPFGQQHEDRSFQPGQSAMAPEDPQYYTPIHTVIDFEDGTLQGKRTHTYVHTQQGSYQFTNATAGVASLQFTHPTDQDMLIETLGVTENQWEQYAFVTALDMYTPFYFTRQAYEEKDNEVVITYVGSSSRARITKTYHIDTTSHNIDLELHVEPLTDEGCTPRIFVPAPHMEEIAHREATHLLVYETGSLRKYAENDVEDRRFWIKPELFGAENRYFIHALVGDDGFVQRAYARYGGEHGVTPILEGPHITQATQWRLSFYCGPKEADALNAVDARLEAALDYGWLTPISKFMLSILKWLYDYLGNYGWAIVVLTALMRLLMLPFMSQAESPSKAKSSEYTRKRKALEKKYKDDQETLMREQYRLAKEYGMMPSVMGCLPMLLQLPVFFALNYALRNSIVLYKAPFMGWIQDLSAPDPYYILPVMIGGALLVNAVTSQQRQQQITLGLLSVLLVGFASSFPAGLALYIAASSIFGVMQTALLRKLRS